MNDIVTPYLSDPCDKLAKAMLQVQKAVTPAKKDAENLFCKNTYATLASVMNACKEALNDAGIWITQYPVPVEQTGHLGLVTKLTHVESGQWQASLLVLPVTKSDPQGIGSTITYARRYALSAILGIVTEEDDDGNAGCGTPHTTPPRQTPPRQRAPQNTVSPPTTTQRPAQPVPPSAQAPLSSNQVQAIIANLPRLDGITYSPRKGKDGIVIVASGNTRDRTTALKAAGFKWASEQKLWWRAA